MRIDAHQHFWRYDAQAYPWMSEDMAVLRRDWLACNLAPLIAAHGIDACIAVQARASEEENAFLLGLTDEASFIAAVVGWVDLFASDAHERIAHWHAHPRFRGVRHLLQDDADVGATLTDPDFATGVRAVQARGLVFDILVRGPDQLAHVPAFCARHDEHALVLDHLGKPAIGGEGEEAWRRHVHAVAAHPHVACKVSGLVTEVVGERVDHNAIFRHLDVALDAFGPDRLLFGSDWPVCLLRADYSVVTTLIHEWTGARGLSTSEREKLWGGTAARCYGLRAVHGEDNGP